MNFPLLIAVGIGVLLFLFRGHLFESKPNKSQERTVAPESKRNQQSSDSLQKALDSILLKLGYQKNEFELPGNKYNDLIEYNTPKKAFQIIEYSNKDLDKRIEFIFDQSNPIPELKQVFLFYKYETGKSIREKTSFVSLKAIQDFFSPRRIKLENIDKEDHAALIKALNELKPGDIPKAIKDLNAKEIVAFFNKAGSLHIENNWLTGELKDFVLKSRSVIPYDEKYLMEKFSFLESEFGFKLKYLPSGYPTYYALPVTLISFEKAGMEVIPGYFSNRGESTLYLFAIEDQTTVFETKTEGTTMQAGAMEQKVQELKEFLKSR